VHFTQNFNQIFNLVHIFPVYNTPDDIICLEMVQDTKELANGMPVSTVKSSLFHVETEFCDLVQNKFVGS